MVPQRPTSTPTLQSSRYTQSSDFPDGLYEDEYSCYPPAIAMIIMSLIEIGIFFYDLVTEEDDPLKGDGAELFIYNPHKRYQVWRYFTYMFVHVG